MVRGIIVQQGPEGVTFLFHDRRFVLGSEPIKNGPISSTCEFGAVRRGGFTLSISDAIALTKNIIDVVSSMGKGAI